MNHRYHTRACSNQCGHPAIRNWGEITRFELGGTALKRHGRSPRDTHILPSLTCSEMKMKMYDHVYLVLINKTILKTKLTFLHKQLCPLASMQTQILMNIHEEICTSCDTRTCRLIGVALSLKSCRL